MKVAIYARVSTKDKDQDPELQLVPLRTHCLAMGWDAVEYVDVASAGDLAGRKDWRKLQQDVRRHLIDRVLVWKLDRAFRSSVHALSTLEEWDGLGVGFTCLTQSGIDTATPMGKLVLAILAAVAEFEKSLIVERVKEGLVNARRKGKRLGRPPATARPGFAREWEQVWPEIVAGRLSLRAAASRLGVGVATVSRLAKDSKPRDRSGIAQKVGGAA